MRKTLFKKCAFERAFEKSLVVIMTLLLWCGVWITGTLLISSVFWYFGAGEFLDLLCGCFYLWLKGQKRKNSK